MYVALRAIEVGEFLDGLTNIGVHGCKLDATCEPKEVIQDVGEACGFAAHRLDAADERGFLVFRECGVGDRLTCELDVETDRRKRILDLVCEAPGEGAELRESLLTACALFGGAKAHHPTREHAGNNSNGKDAARHCAEKERTPIHEMGA
jgi:hypothetical protein